MVASSSHGGILAWQHVSAQVEYSGLINEGGVGGAEMDRRTGAAMWTLPAVVRRE